MQKFAQLITVVIVVSAVASKLLLPPVAFLVCRFWLSSVCSAGHSENPGPPENPFYPPKVSSHFAPAAMQHFYF